MASSKGQRIETANISSALIGSKDPFSSQLQRKLSTKNTITATKK